MRVIVFGASGRVGARFCEYSSAAHDVVAFVRPGSAVGSGPTVVEGDVLDIGDVAAAVKGCDTVCVALGVRGFSESSGSFVDAIKAIIHASVEAGVSRIVTVALSGILPVDEPDIEGANLRMDQADYPEVFLESSRQHLAAYEIIRDSGIDYTVICPPHMPHGERTGNYRVTDESRPADASSISVEDVADLMLDCTEGHTHTGNRVGIAY